MNSNVQRYIIEQLAMTGFAVLAARIAFKLRPDIWTTRLNCGSDFNEAIPKLKQYLGSLLDLQIFEIELAGSIDSARLATRSTDNLIARIQWVTGEAVKRFGPVAEPKPVAVPAVAQGEDPIPNYACEERTRRLAELGLPDNLRRPTSFPRKHSSL
ncbi:MAG: hypothetical protein HY661_19330 [Betaproteobacteria bacterium]|nr:hypothetical protein [Betaproteobacteria bacterium]